MNALLEIEFLNWSPTIVELFGPFALRWYGLGYLAAFAAGYLVLRYTQRNGYWRVAPEDCGALIMYAIVGVFAGGRLGYLLFYSDYFWTGWDEGVLSHLLGILGRDSKGNWSGMAGLSFHGGLLGVALSGILFSYTRAKRQWKVLPDAQRATEGPTGLGKRFRAVFCGTLDACTLGLPIGIFMVRCANYINGELYGRLIVNGEGSPITDAAKAPAWAVRFPTSPEGYGALRDYYFTHPEAIDALKAQGKSLEHALQLPVDPDIWSKIAPQIPFRHPSQLYEGIMEGLVVLALCWLVRMNATRRGIVGGVFLIGYALARIPIELYRQPDTQFESTGELGGWGGFLHSLGLTQGQLLSMLMGLVGLFLLFMVRFSRNPHLVISPDQRAMRASPMTAAQGGAPPAKA